MTRTHRRTTSEHGLTLSACLLMTWMTMMTFAGPAVGAGDGADTHKSATMRFDLPAQPLETALVAFGELTGYSVLVSSSLAAGRLASPVHGVWTPAEALQRLLVGTQLGARFSGSNAFTLLALREGQAAPSLALPEPAPVTAALQTYAVILQRSLTRALCRLH